jgi:peptidoglycan DL-endopeptidase LytE
MELMKLKSFFNKCLFVSLVLFAFNFSVISQERERIVTNEKPESSESVKTTQINPPKYVTSSPTVEKRPALKQNIVIVKSRQKDKDASASDDSLGNLSITNFNQRLQQAIDAKIGIPYRYGSTGPMTFDCSGLVWSVFQSAGNFFERTSAGNYWQKFEPVSDSEKFKFGTLVFFNHLGHVGIVANENGFYHASSSKGVTYSPFAGYWEKRIVGFRRIPMNAN